MAKQQAPFKNLDPATAGDARRKGWRSGDMQTACHRVPSGLKSNVQQPSNVQQYFKAKTTSTSQFSPDALKLHSFAPKLPSIALKLHSFKLYMIHI
jgi:hypothetical protein